MPSLLFTFRFLLFQHRSFPLWLCLAFPRPLLASYKLGQIWCLWLNSLFRFAFFWTFGFIGSICFWSPGMNCLHPTIIPESPAPLVGLLVRDPDSLSLSGHISVLHRPSPDLVKLGCLTPRVPRAFLSVCLGTLFFYNYSPSRALVDILPESLKSAQPSLNHKQIFSGIRGSPLDSFLQLCSSSPITNFSMSSSESGSINHWFSH